MKKADTVTFKVDPKLLEILQAMPNRSEFIRKAILEALNSTCPMCNGSGVLTPSQLTCWEKFAETHELKKCMKCAETHFICKEADEENHDYCPE